MKMLRPAPTTEFDSLSNRDGAGLDAQTADAVVKHLRAAGRRSTAEMLREMRRAFPNLSLAARVRALAALRRP